MSTRNTPPKNRHAASQPATIASNVVANVSHTNICREYTAVKINACTTRRRPACESKINPIRAESTWHSSPGSPSATGTVAMTATALAVGAVDTEPGQRALRYHHPLPAGRSRSSPPSTRRRPTWRSGPVALQGIPTPRHDRLGGPGAAPQPPARSAHRSAVPATVTDQSCLERRIHVPDHRLAVHPARRATPHFPFPNSQARKISRTSITSTSRNAIPDLHIDRHRSIRRRQRDNHPARHAGWSHHRQKGGPMIVAKLGSNRSHDRGSRHRRSRRLTWLPLTQYARYLTESPDKRLDGQRVKRHLGVVGDWPQRRCREVSTSDDDQSVADNEQDEPPGWRCVGLLTILVLVQARAGPVLAADGRVPEPPPVSRRLRYLVPAPSGWRVAGRVDCCMACQAASYSSGESPSRPCWMRRGLYHPSM